ncbi:aspartate/glutamate racemase family protein [Georgenia sp. MJ170]|uniref:aspartate/glutamate racemase family protein n=1 Tax=Georgenia sunbinii TaxID=3117728 RepID=UPI002F25F72A
MSAIAEPPLVGILGGMGPAATVDFYAKLIAATPARSDQEHLRVMIWADPTVPDRSAAITGDGEDPTPKLVEGARRLADAGAAFYVVACNGAHAFLPRVREEVDLDYLSIIDVTADHLGTLPEVRMAGVLATDATLMASLHEEALDRVGIEAVMPAAADQRVVMEAIFALKAGCLTPLQRYGLSKVAANLVDTGADMLIAACTEVPLIVNGEDLATRLVDPTLLLAERAVQYATNCSREA